MKIKLTEFEEYSKAAPRYVDGLAIVQSGIEKKDIHPLVMKLRRLCDEYDGLSFLLITSDHDSKSKLDRKIVKAGKSGRRKAVLVGKKAENHYHALIINESETTDIQRVKNECSDYLKKRRKRRPNLKQQKIMSVWKDCLPIVSYMTRQMNESKPYSYGNFDFAYFDDIRYCKYPDDDSLEADDTITF